MNKALAILLLAACAVPAASQSTATLKGIDVYRSASLDVDKVEQALRGRIDSYMRTINDQRHSVQKNRERLKDELESAARAFGDFTYVDMVYDHYATSAEHSAYITFDVVDAKDAKTRMPFGPAPKAEVSDPGGLLEAWQRYSAMGLALRARGELSFERPTCPAFYCLWGSATPELAALEKGFVDGVPKQQAALLDVLARDARPSRRAAAAQLLSYLQDGRLLSETMTGCLSDPSPEVRAAALQVLSDVASYHKNVFIDVQKVIAALDYPTVSDRSKALGVLVGLVDNPDYRTYLTSRAVPRLLALIRMNNPSAHDLSFTLLGIISGQAHGGREYEAWDKWAGTVISSATAPAVDGH